MVHQSSTTVLSVIYPCLGCLVVGSLSLLSELSRRESSKPVLVFERKITMACFCQEKGPLQLESGPDASLLPAFRWVQLSLHEIESGGAGGEVLHQLSPWGFGVDEVKCSE